MDIIGLMGKKLKLGTYKIKCVSQLFCQDTKNDTGYTISYHRREKTKIRVFLERISFFFLFLQKLTLMEPLHSSYI